jgi:glycine hydroxymethyltransferase
MKDKQIEKLIKAEEIRQKKTISLIASENYVSEDVLKALGSKFTNKYSEGYPGHRYYKGQTYTDKVELLCQERALKLFKLNKDKWAVNVQALSGSPANLAVYLALVPKGEKVMGMSLNHGGHLTHGHKVSATGKIWNAVQYGVNAETEVLDYEEIKKLAIAEKPKMIIAGYTAYPRIVDFKKFREIADACPNVDSNGRGCGAILMVDMSHFAGLVAGGAYPSPFEYADVVTTTVHKTLRGPRSALIFSRKDKTQTSAKGNEVSYSDLIDKAVFPGLQGGPHMNQIAAVAVALKEASTPDFKKYAKQVIKNAKVLAEELNKLGWKIISGGTDTHLILVDTFMNGAGISGDEASNRLEKEGIIVNKNTIPNETRSPMDPSGIRLGTAGETTRGAKEKDMVKLAKKINEALRK